MSAGTGGALGSTGGVSGGTGGVTVALFDYGVGNLHSLGKALEQWGARVRVTRDWEEALGLDALVLPGVGAFSAAVESLPDDVAPIRSALEAGLPCLGICLGMQILFDSSEEGPGRGIGIVPGTVRRLRAEIVPQMGWNAVETADHALFADLPAPETLTAYFANSYVCEPAEGEYAVGWSTHDGDRFVSAVARGATWGTQFHPEKSSHQGRAVIRNFVRMVEARAGDAAGSGGDARAMGSRDEGMVGPAPGGTP